MLQILAFLLPNAALISILFLPESTEGVDVGQVTALDYENEANRTEKWKYGTNIGKIKQKWTVSEGTEVCVPSVECFKNRAG